MRSTKQRGMRESGDAKNTGSRPRCEKAKTEKSLGPWAKLRFRFQFTHEFLVPTAQIVAQPLLDRALFLFGPPA
jgi:hypothetical protein